MVNFYEKRLRIIAKTLNTLMLLKGKEWDRDTMLNQIMREDISQKKAKEYLAVAEDKLKELDKKK